MPKGTKWESAAQAAGRVWHLLKGPHVAGLFHLLLVVAGQGLSQGLWKSLSAFTGHLPPLLSSALLAGRSQGVCCTAQPPIQVLRPSPPAAPCGGASCSNTPAVTETREGDSDRDTGNEWASSSSGMVPVLRHLTPLCVGSEGRQLLTAGALPGSPLLPAQLENLELAVSVPSKPEGHRPCPCCCGIHCPLPGRKNVARQSKSFAGTCKAQSEPLAPEHHAWPEAGVCGRECSAGLQGTRG